MYPAALLLVCNCGIVECYRPSALSHPILEKDSSSRLPTARNVFTSTGICYLDPSHL